LVKLFHADQQLRAAQARLEAASKDVRIQERRVNDLAEKQRLASSKLMESQSQTKQIELDLKTREAHIDKLRTQQQNAKNNKEYQAFLVEINTEKVDKGKIEDELIKYMEQVEKGQKELAELNTQLEAEQAKLQGVRQGIGDKLTTLQSEIDALKPPREAAWNATQAKARELFDRLADRHEGEAMAPITKPDRRREEYVCGACNMELVVDVYNKLHSRDEMLFCPSCRRILYIPQDLPPETAVHKKKPTKPKKAREVGAAPGRQESAVDVMNSITPEPEPETDAESETEPTQAKDEG
ncbi:MAG TPA: C4-type zinc ribbon domain-containing protein, partial [Tepidisphaeraceae bacterium]